MTLSSPPKHDVPTSEGSAVGVDASAGRRDSSASQPQHLEAWRLQEQIATLQADMREREAHFQHRLRATTDSSAADIQRLVRSAWCSVLHGTLYCPVSSTDVGKLPNSARS